MIYRKSSKINFRNEKNSLKLSTKIRKDEIIADNQGWFKL
jgi:hypothetical protein